MKDLKVPSNIDVNTIEIAVDDGVMSSYFCEPKSAGTRPGILLLMEAYGLTEHIKEIARRLAAEGYSVLAPDLYHRDQLTRTFAYDERPKAMIAMDNVNIPQTVQDAKFAFKFLQNRAEISEIGAVGLCMGGALVVPVAAACGRDLKAGASFYGHCDGQWMDVIEHVTAPLMFLYGDLDSVITRADVDQLETRLRDSGKDYQIKRYANAGHAFFNEVRREYNERASTQAWNDLKSFLSEHLGTARIETASPSKTAHSSEPRESVVRAIGAD